MKTRRRTRREAEAARLEQQERFKAMQLGISREQLRALRDGRGGLGGAVFAALLAAPAIDTDATEEK